MRAAGIVAVVTYGVVLATGYKKSKETDWIFFCKVTKNNKKRIFNPTFFANFASDERKKEKENRTLNKRKW